MENVKIEVSMKCEQVNIIEEYGFNYVGEQFEITKVTDVVIVGKGLNIGVGFGIEKDKFNDYFKIVEEQEELTGIDELYDDEYENEELEDLFEVDKVIRSGVATVVILSDGCKGVSKCLPEDKYDRQRGYEIALTKAQIKSLSKKLKRLSK